MLHGSNNQQVQRELTALGHGGANQTLSVEMASLPGDTMHVPPLSDVRQRASKVGGVASNLSSTVYPLIPSFSRGKNRIVNI